MYEILTPKPAALQPKAYLPAKIGEIVYFVLKDPAGFTLNRPALVLHSYRPGDHIPEQKDMILLLIFTGPIDDNARIPKDFGAKRSREGLFTAMVMHGEPQTPGTWHHIYEDFQYGPQTPS